MNIYGRNFRVEIFGESHGDVVGCVLDGVPAGLELSEEDFKSDIARRAAGAQGTTARRESDEPHILSGVYNGCTTGAPLTIIFHNEDTHSSDYQMFEAMPRPGHADFPASTKWGWQNDPRGGGHFSGRLTLPLVAAGVVAKKALYEPMLHAELIELGGEKDSSLWPSILAQAESEGDSVGGVVECCFDAMPVGIGEPFFDSIESKIAHAVFSIPGVRGIEFGDGFEASRMRGSEHNDPLENGRPAKNGAGGVNGGLSNGAPLLFRVAFKPTSSISRPQRTWNFETESMETLEIRGRHDVCFALRTPVIVEAVTAIALLDLCGGN